MSGLMSWRARSATYGDETRGVWLTDLLAGAPRPDPRIAKPIKEVKPRRCGLVVMVVDGSGIGVMLLGG